MKVLKFGGTSVGSPEAARRAAAIVLEERAGEGCLVVVSALSGTTDALLKAIRACAGGDLDTARALQAGLRERHWAQARALGLEAAVRPHWEPLFQCLSGLMEGMGLLWEATPRAKDAALAVGETLSARLFAALLAQAAPEAGFRDAREVLRTDGRHGRARPDPARIREACAPWREALDRGALQVTQGFLGQAPDGAATTLGRGGSDTSATLLGEALGAAEVQIWTDVDGVLTADPSLVPAARPIPVMSLREAAALSAFGAKVLHADALAPLARAGCPLVVANTLRPHASRTRICLEPPPRALGEITSVAYKEGLACLRLPPDRDPEALFQAAGRLLEAGASLYGLQATPDGSLLVVLPETPDAEAVLETLAGVWDLQRGWAAVALVGEGLRGAPGRTLGHLRPLDGEPIGAILAGDTGVSLAFLVPQERLAELIPRLHAHCLEGLAIHEILQAVPAS
jgi:aspartate kinase